MNRLRCLLIAAMVVLSSATFALGGEIQGPGKSEPLLPPPTSASTASTSDDPAQPAFPEATAMLMEILLSIF